MKTVYLPDLKKKNLETACQLLQNGGIIGFPTETVYGLGVLLSKKTAIQKLFELKKRDKQKAFTLHLGSLDQVDQVAIDIPQDFYLLAKHFMPGPLTVILKKKPGLSDLASPFPTIGVRIPSHALFLKLAGQIKEPIVGTSANFSNEKPEISAEEVLNQFNGQIAAVIEGGPAVLKTPSTVLSLVDKPLILREGSLKKEALEAVLQKKLAFL